MSFDDEITDPQALRAMAHPVRWRILDELRRGKALTATEVSERIGESPANCSFHLRTLAKYGFIEEAGGGAGRNRPWRARDVSLLVVDDPTAGAVEGARELRDVVRVRAFRAIQRWERGQGPDYPQRWRTSATEAEWDIALTSAELAEVGARIRAVLAEYVDREAPDDAVPCVVNVWAFPVGDPRGESGAPRS